MTRWRMWGWKDGVEVPVKGVQWRRAVCPGQGRADASHHYSRFNKS